MAKYYYINKRKMKGDIVYIDYNKLKGYNVTPQNHVKYDGIMVNKMIIVKQSFIEKLLKRKIKRKLNLYLNLIISLIEEDGTDDSGMLSESLNDLTRYRSIVEYKYRKYLDEKYINLLLKKINLLEYEIKSKISLKDDYKDVINNNHKKK